MTVSKFSSSWWMTIPRRAIGVAVRQISDRGVQRRGMSFSLVSKAIEYVIQHLSFSLTFNRPHYNHPPGWIPLTFDSSSIARQRVLTGEVHGLHYRPVHRRWLLSTDTGVVRSHLSHHPKIPTSLPTWHPPNRPIFCTRLHCPGRLPEGRPSSKLAAP